MRPHLLPMSWSMKALAGGYVVLVGALGFAGWSEPGSVVAEVVGFVLMLPSIVVALPVIYVVGAVAWTTADDSGQATWQVTTTFTLLFALTAAVNVLVVWWLVSAVARSRRRLAIEAPTAPPS